MKNRDNYNKLQLKFAIHILNDYIKFHNCNKLYENSINTIKREFEESKNDNELINYFISKWRYWSYNGSYLLKNFWNWKNSFNNKNNELDIIYLRGIVYDNNLNNK